MLPDDYDDEDVGAISHDVWVSIKAIGMVAALGACALVLIWIANKIAEVTC